jgi:putative pyruvate formate lyase activating enzyme
MITPQVSYITLLHSGELENRVIESQKHLAACDVCALKCLVNRRQGETGSCKTGEYAKVSSFGPHFGEENPIRGYNGSGTIFFARCNLRCQYCQNYSISQINTGQVVRPEQLSSMMLELQNMGCHNINLVSPSHLVPQILAGIFIAAQNGLQIPLVYNTGGYDSLAMLHLLDGIIDIYMPDMKYANAQVGKKYSKIPNYPKINQAAIKEMHRQVGDLQINSDGIATRGLLIRHLVLPNNLAGTKKIVSFLANNISPNTYLNVMDQYHPAFQSNTLPDINRQISDEEYQQAVQWAQTAGLKRLDKRRS